jgi:hypothetical protein
MGLVIALSQLPSLIAVVTDPTVSIVDQAFPLLLLLGALSLLTLGLRRLRHPQLFADRPSDRTVRPLLIYILAGVLFGVGILMYVIVS